MQVASPVYIEKSGNSYEKRVYARFSWTCDTFWPVRSGTNKHFSSGPAQGDEEPYTVVPERRKAGEERHSDCAGTGLELEVGEFRTSIGIIGGVPISSSYSLLGIVILRFFAIFRRRHHHEWIFVGSRLRAKAHARRECAVGILGFCGQILLSSSRCSAWRGW